MTALDKNASKLVARCWMDPTFREEFMADPKRWLLSAETDIDLSQPPELTESNLGQLLERAVMAVGCRYCC